MRYHKKVVAIYKNRGFVMYNLLMDVEFRHIRPMVNEELGEELKFVSRG